MGEQDAGDPGDQREQQALGEQLPDDARAACAKRRPHGHLPGAAGRLAQEQRGGVGARDQEHQPGDAPEQVQGRAHVTHQLVVQPAGSHPTSRIGVGVLPLEARGDGRQLRPGALERHRWFQAADGEVRVPAAAGRLGPLGDPQVRQPGKPEAGRQHADDRPGVAADSHGPFQDVGVGVETPLPIVVADERRAAAGLRFLGSERAPDDRLDAEHAKEVGVHDGDARILRDLARGHGELATAVGGHRLEGRALVAPVAEVGDPGPRRTAPPNRGRKER